MNIIILTKLTPEGGNKTTAERIRYHLVSCGHQCDIQDTTLYHHTHEFTHHIQTQQANCVIGIHLLRSGKLLLACDVPLIMIFGGTDINEHYKRDDYMSVMTKIVQKAIVLVAFSPTMADKAKQLWPDISTKTIIQPQAVLTKPSMFSQKDLIKMIINENAHDEDVLYLNNNEPKTTVLFLLVTGLRRVKDPMFLFNVMSAWHHEDNNVFLVVIGPEIDPVFSTEVKMQAKKYPGVVVLPALTQQDLHALIKYHTKCVVNTSLSEGMSSIILEALALETVVLARNIAGNQSIITHNNNGLLFNTPQEFLSLAKSLISDDKLYSELVKNGKQFIEENHSLEKERDTYQKIIEHI